ncbi:MAG: Fe-Mn family superoxide dismutase [Acidobacteriia bacterium]|nr:Fe-Mn family superoxide dismutase [Terriglobia bacterium]
MADSGIFWPGWPVGNLGQAITGTFGGFDSFKGKSTAAAVGRFGSGWAWLLKTSSDLEIIIHGRPGFTAHGRQVSGHRPRCVAYYLKYKNRRPDYLSAWWSGVN